MRLDSSERKSFGNVPKQPTARNEGGSEGGVGEIKRYIFGKRSVLMEKVGADWDTSFSVCKIFRLLTRELRLPDSMTGTSLDLNGLSANQVHVAGRGL